MCCFAPANMLPAMTQCMTMRFLIRQYSSSALDAVDLLCKLCTEHDICNLDCLHGAVYGAQRGPAGASRCPAEGLQQARRTVRRLAAVWPRCQVWRLCTKT